MMVLADIEFKPTTELTVPPNVIVVVPNVVALFANWPFAMAALLAMLFVVKPVAEMVPALIEIPEPAVKFSWTPNPVISAFEIFNFENAIAALASMSASAIVVLVAKDPKPKFVLAPDAVVAPVPPFATAILVPLQVPLVIVPKVQPVVPLCCARIFPAPSAKIILLLNVEGSPVISVPMIVL